MFILDEISSAIENLALLVEEKVYTLTHPFLWDRHTSSSSAEEEDGTMSEEEDGGEEDDVMGEFYRSSLEIARDSLSLGRRPDPASEPVGKKMPKFFEGVGKLQELVDEPSKEVLNLIEKLNTETISENEKLDILKQLQDKSISIELSKLLPELIQKDKYEQEYEVMIDYDDNANI